MAEASVNVKSCIQCGFAERDKRGECKVCKRRGHTAAWAAKNKERRATTNAAWHADNKERVRAKANAWRIANRGRLLEKRRASYAANREREVARSIAWAKANAEKVAVWSVAYRAANKEKIAAVQAVYRAANKDRLSVMFSAWAKENAAQLVVSHARWRKENPEAVRIASHNRRARKSENGGKLSKGIIAKLLKLQQGKCACCGTPLDRFHLDHIVPLKLGGLNVDANMQLLTQRCNQQKRAKHPVDFMQQRGFLI